MDASIQTEQRPAASTADCLNCDTPLQGNFCLDCGQERGQKIVSLHESIIELLNEFVKFDAKLLATFRYLVTRPGFLTSAYAAGKRASYLQPIKLYLSINFFLFLLAGWLDPIALTEQEIDIYFAEKTLRLETFNANLSTVLPPLLIIVSPIFAALLKLIYIRSTQYFALHFIFSLHFFSFFMLAMLPGLVSEELLNWVSLPASALYMLLAQRTVYGQSWLKTIAKWLVLLAAAAVLLLVWFFIGLLYAYLVTPIPA